MEPMFCPFVVMGHVIKQVGQCRWLLICKTIRAKGVICLRQIPLWITSIQAIFRAHLIAQISRKIYRLVLGLHKIDSQVARNCIIMRKIHRKPEFSLVCVNNYASASKNLAFWAWKKLRLSEKSPRLFWNFPRLFSIRACFFDFSPDSTLYLHSSLRFWFVKIFRTFSSRCFCLHVSRVSQVFFI